MRRFAPLLVAPLLVALLLIGCDGTDPPPEVAQTVAARPPIVLISIDTLRSDHLPIYGYDGVETPAIDAFRRDAILFERAYAHYPLTLPSHTALLSGQLPTENGVRDNSGYRVREGQSPWLPSLLREAGYATAGAVSTYALNASTGINQGFDVYDDETDNPATSALFAAERAGAKTLEVARAWLDTVGARPFFLLFHIYEPHEPLRPTAPHRERWGETYEGEIATADEIVGDLLDDLKRRGLYDRALIILLSDHGEGLGDHGEDTHGILLYREAIQVPLLIKLPGADQAGASVDVPVQLIDVAPTVLEVAELEAPGKLGGLSLLSLLAARPTTRRLYAETMYPRLHFGWGELTSLISGPWQLIDGPNPELYNLLEDPAQRHNVLRQNRAIYRDLRDHLGEIERPFEPPSTSEDAETRAKLEALGYLSSDSAPADGPLLDPRTQLVAISARLDQAMTHFDLGENAEAAEMLRALVDENPAMTVAWESLGTALYNLGRYEEALEAYERTLTLSQGAPQSAFLVGRALTRLGRLDEARAHAEIARRFEPRLASDLELEIALALVDSGRSAEAAALVEPIAGRRDDAPSLNMLARALLAEGRLAEAIPIVERALERDPKSALAWEHRGLVALERGRAADAKTALQRSVELDDHRANAWNLLAVAFYQSGDPSAALDAWQRAVNLDPMHFDALYNLAMTAASSGRLDLARRALRQYLASAPAERFARELAQARQVLGQIGG